MLAQMAAEMDCPLGRHPSSDMAEPRVWHVWDQDPPRDGKGSVTTSSQKALRRMPIKE